MGQAESGGSSSEAARDEVDQADLTALQGSIQKGELDHARRRAEALLKAHPESAKLYNILGIIALLSGKNETAQGFLRKALELSPGFTSAAENLGVALMKQKQFEAAIDVLQQALIHEPGSLQARTNLANAYLNAKQFRQAFDQSTELLNLSPDKVEFLKIRATAASKLGDWPTVHTALNGIEAASGKSDWSVSARFDALANSGQVEEAVAFGEAHAGDHPAIMTPLGELMLELGRFEDGRDRLRKAIREDPDNARAYFHYGMSKRWSEDDPVLEQLKASADRFDRTRQPGGESAFFALAKASMDLERHEAVFPALHKANEFQGRGWRFEAGLQEKQTRDIREAWTASSINALSGVGVEDVRPIFIIGMPRSGSTLTEHVIEAHPEVISVGEASITARFFPTDMRAARDTLAQAAQDASKDIRRLAGPEKRLLDKYLYNYQRLGSLAAAFPRAKFVHTKRDPRAIALSIYSNPLKIELHPYSTKLTDIAHFFVQYHSLMEHWKSTLGDRIIVSDYQTLVEDPEPSIRDLIERLGLPWDDACLKPEAVQKRVRTLSVAQVRSGIHSGSVELWRHYEAELAPFTEIVSEVCDLDGN